MRWQRLGPVSAQTGDSQICALGQDDYQAFLERNAPEISRIRPIITTHGEQIGLHRGLPFYTIGQRKGLGVSAPTPLFVVAKDMARNALIVGYGKNQAACLCMQSASTG